MEPLSPNDPLWKLLGQAKGVEPRPNFTQNVLRQARQTAQERGLWSRVRAWFEEGKTGRLAWVGAAAAAVIALLAVLPLGQNPGAELAQAPERVPQAVAEVSTAEAEVSPLPESDTQWANIEQFDALLAVYDTSELSDRDIHFLLY